MGFNRAELEQSLPLAETQGFTAFMYDWVMRQNPVGRLGYSLWAEGTQELLPKVIARLKSKFSIGENRAISFFTVHAVLDARHGQEARANIDRFAVTVEDRQAVRTVAHTSLKLFIGVLEAMYDHYLQVRAGAPLVRQLPTA
jgi:pyrroloquinoline quinone (PQQ) biosynthesis protein C